MRQITNIGWLVCLCHAGADLHVHVEGGLAVVLLPPARAPRGRVHAAVSRRAPRLTPNTSEVTFMSDADGTSNRLSPQLMLDVFKTFCRDSNDHHLA